MNNLTLTQADRKYWDFILDLINYCRENFTNSQYISQDTHYAFMQKHDYKYRICLDQNRPVGFIGEVNDDIRIAVRPNFKCNGIGKFMIHEFLKEFHGGIAKVKIGNKASVALFESCGFKKKYYVLEKE